MADVGEKLPNWMKQYQGIIGLKVLTDEEFDASQINTFTLFIIFFISSVYIKSELRQWHNDDIELKKEIDDS